ncbi:SPASM domain-containing protein [Vibrio coralliirubri]|uniref:radical SAM/SPASM domain-containing protein n=1 Tax=Vibrio coralliirubri TaxID=1516159 RepID=UPI0022850E74|nr:SPASM domain-containing protein [Vibrio coralliirubri]MCY9861051.1 SPASM domain-containing protein [Vibrio coralliirubri]
MKCNLSCQHCFLHQEVRDQKKSMTKEEFRHVVDMMATDFRNDNEASFAEVTILGGEPTLMPPSFYLENIPYLKAKFAESNKPISLTLVTNFTTTKALKRYSNLFDVVSTSYEWDRFDSQLIIKGTAGSKKQQWWNNLRDWTSEQRPIAISLATTKETIQNWREMFELLYQSGVRFFQVNLMHPDGELMKGILSTEDYQHFEQHRLDILTNPLAKLNYHYKPKDNAIMPSFEEEADFLIALTRWLDEKNDDGLVIYPINSHKESIKSGVGNSDIACPASGAMCVTTTGEVSGCTIESGKIEMINYGNALTDSLDAIMDSETRARHIQSLSIKPIACLGCEYYYFCQGSCSFRELFWDATNEDSECHGLKSYFNYIKENY